MSTETREYAKKLTAQMTLEEKMSQMLYESPAIDRLGIPAYNWWNEALHGVARAGVATVFPQAIALAATFDEDLLQKIGDVVSTEGRAKFNEFSRKGDRGIYKGLTFWAPNVNIFRDPRWGRGHETYGEDPYLTGKLGSIDQLKDELGRAIKRFAKRQTVWFRRDKGVLWLDMEKDPVSQAAAAIENFIVSKKCF